MKHLVLTIQILAFPIVVSIPQAMALENPVLCKSFLGFVKVREGSCRRRETQILLPQGEDTHAGTICQAGEVLLGGGSCKVLSPAAFCGNGQLDAGEQCDEGANNGAGNICAETCTYNCPCNFFDIQLSDWQNETLVAYGQDLDGCTLVAEDQRPQAFVSTSKHSCNAIPDNGEPEPDSQENLSPTQVSACSLTLTAYANEVVDSGIVVTAPGEIFCGSL